MPKEHEKAAMVDAEVRPEPEPMLTPEEHAKAEKQFVGVATRYARIGDQSPTIAQYTWQHNAAAALHGWDAHAHHAGEPIRMTAKAYRNALRAASSPDERGEYLPHDAALSPHCPHQRKG